MSAAAAWEALVRAALLGTERHPAPADVATGEVGLDDALAALADRPSEPRMLETAALLDAWRRAGVRAPRTAVRPAPAPDGDARPCPAEAARVLRQALSGAPAPLLAEWMTLADGAGVAPPPELLPAVLDFARRHPEVRDAVARGIGARGRWLASLNPHWSAGPDPRADPAGAWATGTAQERLALLRALRQTDAPAALALVRSTWAADPARDRTAFVEALRTGVGMDDEPFLESALDDRSKGVREAAARLLSALPGSRLVGRMVERLDPLLRPQAADGLLARIRQARPRIDVQLPAECDRAMQRDGVEPRSHPGVGERGGWLRQMAASVPPSVWTQRWGMDAAACLDAARASDEEGQTLLAGWTEATLRARDAEWAEAVLRSPSPGDVARMAEVLSPERLQALALERLEPLVRSRLRQDGGLTGGHPTTALLSVARFSWSPALTRAAVAAVPVEPSPWDTGLAHSLMEFALRMHPATAVATLRELGGPHEGAWVDLLHLRHTLHQALS